MINTQKIDIAIFTAMPEEMAYFKNKFAELPTENVVVNHFTFKVYQYKKHKILLAETELGTTFAAAILTLIHQHFSPNYVFL